MILTIQDIKEILLNNPNKEIITAGVKYNKTMRLHLYGDGMDSHLTTIEGFETPAIRELRVKYSTNNKDLTSRLKRPIDKVFSARGGSVYYNLSDGQDKKAMAIAGNVKGGLSVKKWIENFWMPHYLDDPYGIIFMEIDQEGEVYPTYKAITSIFSYKYNGSALEYIVFEATKAEKRNANLKEDEKIYRVVDDVFDYYVKLENEDVTILENLSYPNFFPRVPAVINSDINNSAGEGFLSLLDDVITLADTYLLKGSIKTTHDFLHGFPKYWEYADDCTTCGGAKYHEAKPCTDCKGTGKRLMTKVSDAKLLNYPQSKDEPMVTPNVAGYVEPSDIYYGIATSELSALESAMHHTLWGSDDQPKTPGLATNQQGQTKTATQIVSDQQPKIDRLSQIADSAEKRHKFILDHIIEIKLKEGYIESGGSSVNYGRRFMIESPDAIWDRYSEAKTKGAAVSVLDDLLQEFIETKYQGDPVSMAIQVKLMKLEPFVHLTIQQVQTLAPSPEDYAAKLYFGEWLSNNSEGNYILITPLDVLRQQLFDYAKGKSDAITAANEAKMKAEAATKQPFNKAA
jgi:hypothetical protein